MIDTELRDNVLDELSWEPMVDPAEIGVSVSDGVVMLTGFVESFAEKTAAEEAAKRVYGVRAVANDIEVHLPGSMARTDADIARAARNVLDWSTMVPSDDITVTVRNGWVTLEGSVDWQYQKEAAANAVRNLTGVKGVENMISLRERSRSTEIESKIEEALRRSAEVDARRISVERQDGTVVLRGNVRSWFERMEAESAAWSAPGVTEVDNEITVTA
jgi:osmotically-inducible protein OsmY